MYYPNIDEYGSPYDVDSSYLDKKVRKYVTSGDSIDRAKSKARRDYKRKNTVLNVSRGVLSGLATGLGSYGLLSKKPYSTTKKVLVPVAIGLGTGAAVMGVSKMKESKDNTNAARYLDKNYSEKVYGAVGGGLAAGGLGALAVNQFNNISHGDNPGKVVNLIKKYPKTVIALSTVPGVVAGYRIATKKKKS